MLCWDSLEPRRDEQTQKKGWDGSCVIICSSNGWLEMWCHSRRQDYENVNCIDCCSSREDNDVILQEFHFDPVILHDNRPTYAFTEKRKEKGKEMLDGAMYYIQKNFLTRSKFAVQRKKKFKLVENLSQLKFEVVEYWIPQRKKITAPSPKLHGTPPRFQLTRSRN